MKRALIRTAYGIAGLALAVGMTVGAYFVAGRDLSTPVRPVRMVVPLAPAGASPKPIAKAKASPHGSASAKPRPTSTGHGSDEGSGRHGDSGSSGSDSGHGSDDSGDD